ncbi:unnamed protein product [Protopolystoma xenopodis]|uniref:Cadherin domain-containing protein n=1 Tax=Protopolystoma xenopodis TaxID=117903 RepID=A0A448WJ52_9PLAT|nr:unnamed protein product [Protopolystoma xenopodis]
MLCERPRRNGFVRFLEVLKHGSNPEEVTAGVAEARILLFCTIQLIVYARDGGSSCAFRHSDDEEACLTASTQVHVTVLDINDHAPEFLEPRLFEVFENASRGTWIGDLVARDQDAGENSRITFYLTPRSSQTRRFSLRLNGSLYISEPLDREEEVRIPSKF